MSEAELRAALRVLGGVAGSVHRRVGDRLELVSHTGLPPKIIPLISSIPKGKGMAGQAWLRKEPTLTCHLATDPNAPIEPGARAVDAQGAIAIPIFNRADDVIAVVGFAFAGDDEFDADRLERCRIAARGLAGDYAEGGAL